MAAAATAAEVQSALSSDVHQFSGFYGWNYRMTVPSQIAAGASTAVSATAVL